MGLRTVRVISFSLAVSIATVTPLYGENPDKAALQQRVAELKKSVADNQAKLRKYQWLETTQVSVKGETKKKEDQQCRYGPDGKVVKTPVAGNPQQPQEQPRGLKKKIVEKKVAETKDYAERVKSLIGHYVPPETEKMQAALQAGHASLSPAGNITTITFTDYYKPGDKVTFGYDTSAKKLRSYDINTFLDDPVKDVVTMTNQFASLPDGTNYLQQTVLDMKAKEIQITNTNGGYSLVGQ